MRPVLVILAFALLASCGGKSSPRENKEQNERRTCFVEKSIVQPTCLFPSKWILNTRLTTLPKNIRIEAVYKISPEETYRNPVANNCQRKGSVMVISSGTGSSLFFESHGLHSAEEFSIELIDQGEDCKGNTLFLKVELVKEDVRTENGQRGTFSIDLD